MTTDVADIEKYVLECGEPLSLRNYTDVNQILGLCYENCLYFHKSRGWFNFSFNQMQGYAKILDTSYMIFQYITLNQVCEHAKHSVYVFMPNTVFERKQAKIVINLQCVMLSHYRQLFK